MGIGDWGLGIGDWGLGPIANAQSPFPSPINQSKKFLYSKEFIYFIINYLNKLNIKQCQKKQV